MLMMRLMLMMMLMMLMMMMLMMLMMFDDDGDGDDDDGDGDDDDGDDDGDDDDDGDGGDDDGDGDGDGDDADEDEDEDDDEEEEEDDERKMMMWMLRRRRRKTTMLRRKANPKTGKHTLCEPAACAVEMYTDISQEPFCVEIYRNSAVRQARDARFVRACAVEMHMDMSQEAFCAEIYGENAGRFRYHLDWTPGLNTYRKTPSVWTHCLGKNCWLWESPIFRLYMGLVDFHSIGKISSGMIKGGQLNHQSLELHLGPFAPHSGSEQRSKRYMRNNLASAIPAAKSDKDLNPPLPVRSIQCVCTICT